jgi:hypothetical protein
MHEFETFVYLDVQKTGSTFISHFLRKFCTEKEIRREHHARLPEDFDTKKFCFISVRDPLDQYLSLYSYGCEAQGKLFARLYNEGLGDFYDGTWPGFRGWLNFVLEPENANLMGEGYGTRRTGTASSYIGFQSYRVFALAVPAANRLLAASHTKEAASEIYDGSNTVNYVIKNETLRSDLIELINTRLRNSITDIAEAIRFIEQEKSHNASDRVDRYASNPRLGKQLRLLLESREWLLYEKFGY